MLRRLTSWWHTTTQQAATTGEGSATANETRRRYDRRNRAEHTSREVPCRGWTGNGQPCDSMVARRRRGLEYPHQQPWCGNCAYPPNSVAAEMLTAATHVRQATHQATRTTANAARDTYWHGLQDTLMLLANDSEHQDCQAVQAISIRNRWARDLHENLSDPLYSAVSPCKGRTKQGNGKQRLPSRYKPFQVNQQSVAAAPHTCDHSPHRQAATFLQLVADTANHPTTRTPNTSNTSTSQSDSTERMLHHRFIEAGLVDPATGHVVVPTVAPTRGGVAVCDVINMRDAFDRFMSTSQAGPAGNQIVLIRKQLEPGKYLHTSTSLHLTGDTDGTPLLFLTFASPTLGATKIPFNASNAERACRNMNDGWEPEAPCYACQKALRSYPDGTQAPTECQHQHHPDTLHYAGGLVARSLTRHCTGVAAPAATWLRPLGQPEHRVRQQARPITVSLAALQQALDTCRQLNSPQLTVAWDDGCVAASPRTAATAASLPGSHLLRLEQPAAVYFDCDPTRSRSAVTYTVLGSVLPVDLRTSEQLPNYETRDLKIVSTG